MNKMKRIIVLGIAVIGCIVGVVLGNSTSHAATMYPIFVDAAGGTFYQVNNNGGFDCYNCEEWIEENSTLASIWQDMQDPTAPNMQFVGWLGYNKDTGAPLENGKLFTTQEVFNYVMPNHAIQFVAQWNGTPVTSITYAALYNGTGEVDYNAKISIIHNGISYSGYGFVSIQQDIFSTWTNNITIRYEYPGEFVDSDFQYVPDFIEWESTLYDFKFYQVTYMKMYKTSGGKEQQIRKSVVNKVVELSDATAPNVSTVTTETAGNIISDSTIVPSTYTVSMDQYQSGSIYEQAVSEALTQYGSSNVLVYNIDLKDDNGMPVHQLSGMVDVTLLVPNDFTVQQGNRVVVYYMNDDGTLEECETTYDDVTKTVTFKTNHFSVYVIAEVDDVEDENGNGASGDSSDVENPDNDQTPEEDDDGEIEHDCNLPEDTGANDDNINKSATDRIVWVVIVAAVVVVGIVVIIILSKKRKI